MSTKTTPLPEPPAEAEEFDYNAGLTEAVAELDAEERDHNPWDDVDIERRFDEAWDDEFDTRWDDAVERNFYSDGRG